jgi:hypothetical protein
MGLCCGIALDAGLNYYFGETLSGAAGGAVVDEAIEVGRLALAAAMDQREVENVEQVDMDGYAKLVAQGVDAVIAHEVRRRLPETPPHAAAVQMRHEFTVSALDEPARNVHVVGFSDKIEEDGEIVDHKWSGSAKWDKAGTVDPVWFSENYDQLAEYWLSRRAEERRGLPQPAPVVPRGRIVVCYHRLGMLRPQVREFPAAFDETDERRVIGIIRWADAAIRRGHLPARPGVACKFCSYVGRCRSDEERNGTPFALLVGAGGPAW